MKKKTIETNTVKSSLKVHFSKKVNVFFLPPQMSNPLDSLLIKKFIHILNPVLEEDDEMTYTFTATMLKYLAISLWSFDIKRLFNVARTLLLQSKDYSPIKNPLLLESINRFLKIFPPQHLCTLKNNPGFINNTDTERPKRLRRKDFEAILENLVYEIQNIYPELCDIEKLIVHLTKNWLSSVKNSKLIDPNSIHQIESYLMNAKTNNLNTY